jgi:hypothetical protein
VFVWRIVQKSNDLFVVQGFEDDLGIIFVFAGRNVILALSHNMWNA